MRISCVYTVPEVSLVAIKYSFIKIYTVHRVGPLTLAVPMCVETESSYHDKK